MKMFGCFVAGALFFAGCVSVYHREPPLRFQARAAEFKNAPAADRIAAGRRLARALPLTRLRHGPGLLHHLLGPLDEELHFDYEHPSYKLLTNDFVVAAGRPDRIRAIGDAFLLAYKLGADRKGRQWALFIWTYKDYVRACLKTTRGAVFGEKAGWQGATKENTPGGSSTEEQRGQTAFSPKTLRAAGLLSVARVGSVVAARCGDAPTSPPWPQPKSLAAAPLVVFKQALSSGTVLDLFTPEMISTRTNPDGSVITKTNYLY